MKYEYLILGVFHGTGLHAWVAVRDGAGRGGLYRVSIHPGTEDRDYVYQLQVFGQRADLLALGNTRIAPELAEAISAAPEEVESWAWQDAAFRRAEAFCAVAA